MPAIAFALRPRRAPIHFLATHPRPPVNASSTQSRNDQLGQIATLTSAGLPESQVVLGDLNLSPFSRNFDRFLQQSGLHDSALGFGLPSTWMAGTPLGVPIDHCLISPDLRVLDRDTGPRLGSDHSPLILHLMIP